MTKSRSNFYRARVPLDWAATQNDLGNALAALGERESGTARLEDAAAAFHEALKEYTRGCAPLPWAGTLNNLAGTLQLLGERESGTARLEEALAAFREAVKGCTRIRTPSATPEQLRDRVRAALFSGAAIWRCAPFSSGTIRLQFWDVWSGWQGG